MSDVGFQSVGQLACNVVLLFVHGNSVRNELHKRVGIVICRLLIVSRGVCRQRVTVLRFELAVMWPTFRASSIRATKLRRMIDTVIGIPTDWIGKATVGIIFISSISTDFFHLRSSGRHSST